MKVLVFGTFDGLHDGHRFVLDEASKRGDLFVVVGRDSTVEKIKGHVPKQHEQERMEAIETAYPHADVILGDEEDYLIPVRSAEPDLILLGYDQRLPPGVSENDLHCKIIRLGPHQPEKFKSSLM